MGGKNLLRLDNPQPSPTAGESVEERREELSFFLFSAALLPAMGAVHRPNGGGGRKGLSGAVFHISWERTRGDKPCFECEPISTLA